MTFDKADIEVLALCAWCRDLPVHGCRNIPAKIINDLLADKAELLRIAQIYEQEFASQKITDDDIEFITKNGREFGAM